MARPPGPRLTAASEFAGKPFQEGISDSHSLLEFSEQQERHRIDSLDKDRFLPTSSGATPLRQIFSYIAASSELVGRNLSVGSHSGTLAGLALKAEIRPPCDQAFC